MVPGYQRYCLNMQGYGQFTDEQKRQIDLAQRFKPGVCSAAILMALFTQSVPWAVLAIVLGYWGALLPYHPADLVYQGVLRPLFHAPDLGADPIPRRFACGMAATLLLVGVLAWQLGATLVGTVVVAGTAAASL